MEVKLKEKPTCISILKLTLCSGRTPPLASRLRRSGGCMGWTVPESALERTLRRGGQHPLSNASGIHDRKREPKVRRTTNTNLECLFVKHDTCTPLADPGGLLGRLPHLLLTCNSENVWFVPPKRISKSLPMTILGNSFGRPQTKIYFKFIIRAAGSVDILNQVEVWVCVGCFCRVIG